MSAYAETRRLLYDETCRSEAGEITHLIMGDEIISRMRHGDYTQTMVIETEETQFAGRNCGSVAAEPSRTGAAVPSQAAAVPRVML